MTYQLFVGNNLEILPTLPDNSVDSIVTDPPYGLSDNKYVADTIARWIAGERDFVPDGKGFMGKSWDAFVPPPALWDECLRVLKPGGHLLSFFGSRTQDIGALAIRLAGFEIRDSIAWLYGSGFPKSLNLTDDWQGWGTALKPALEPIVVARKPITEGTIAANVNKWGTGALNIDASRIGTDEVITNHSRSANAAISKGKYGDSSEQKTHQTEGQKSGRWPANIILSHTELCKPTGKTLKNKTSAGKRTATFGTQETQSGGDGSGGWSGYEYETEVYQCVDGCPVKLLDEQSGQVGNGWKKNYGKDDYVGRQYAGGSFGGGGYSGTNTYADSGGASRFFYVAKATKTDRSEGLADLPLRKSDQRSEVAAGIWADMEAPKQNFHPTVKPTALMEYLIRLVTPPGGTVLDPFTGSGSTGKAAILNGFDFIGIEMTEDYVPIIEGRLKHAEKTVADAKEQETLEETEKLF
jgi:site-specific DNA-methyltransferase (adenine-specific)